MSKTGSLAHSFGPLPLYGYNPYRLGIESCLIGCDGRIGKVTFRILQDQIQNIAQSHCIKLLVLGFYDQSRLESGAGSCELNEKRATQELTPFDGSLNGQRRDGIVQVQVAEQLAALRKGARKYHLGFLDGQFCRYGSEARQTGGSNGETAKVGGVGFVMGLVDYFGMPKNAVNEWLVANH
ncbi:hypothetical protein IV102_28490, partial [bacterium]|nr:hypothetical protein [bacterium]